MRDKILAFLLVMCVLCWFLVVPAVVAGGLVWCVVKRWGALTLFEHIVLLYSAVHFVLLSVRNIINYLLTSAAVGGKRDATPMA